MKQLLLLFQSRRRKPVKPPAKVVTKAARPPRSKRMQDKYDQLVDQMKAEHGFRIRKWRQSMSGCAWMVQYEDGTLVKLIESPYPRGPMSAAIFLHEVGHHAIGFGVYKPRCLEELRAWEWSLQAMERHGLNVTDRVRERMDESLRYAVAKALRRGLKTLPADLVPYLPASVTTESLPVAT